MEESFENNIDDLVIKDKKFRKTRRNKLIKFILLILAVIIIIAVITFVIYKRLTINYGKIICIYRTKIDNEKTLKIYLSTKLIYINIIMINNWGRRIQARI